MRRIQWISALALSFFVSQLVGLLVQDNRQLQYAVILVGISYGALFGLIPTIVVEWFGIGLYSPLLPLELQKLTHLMGSPHP